MGHITRPSGTHEVVQVPSGMILRSADSSVLNRINEDNIVAAIWNDETPIPARAQKALDFVCDTAWAKYPQGSKMPRRFKSRHQYRDKNFYRNNKATFKISSDTQAVRNQFYSYATGLLTQSLSNARKYKRNARLLDQASNIRADFDATAAELGDYLYHKCAPALNVMEVRRQNMQENFRRRGLTFRPSIVLSFQPFVDPSVHQDMPAYSLTFAHRRAGTLLYNSRKYHPAPIMNFFLWLHSLYGESRKKPVFTAASNEVTLLHGITSPYPKRAIWHSSIDMNDQASARGGGFVLSLFPSLKPY